MSRNACRRAINAKIELVTRRKAPCFIDPVHSVRGGSSQFLHLRLRLLQPEPHVHLAVHRRSGGEVLAGLLLLARAPTELAEAEVAVGDEGAHAARLAERQSVAVVGLSALWIERLGVGR